MSSAPANTKIPIQASSGKKTLRFGLVSVGVSLCPALDDSTRISAKLRDPESLGPVKQAYVNEAGEIVKPIKAYPYGDQFVPMEKDEVEALDSDGGIQLVASIPLADLPMEWVQSTYLCWPTDSSHDQGYSLLAGYCKDGEAAFIGTTVAQGTTKAFALRWSPLYGCLVAQHLAYSSRVRWEKVRTVSAYVEAMPELDRGMVDTAEAIFSNLPAEFDWESVTDEYGERLAEAVEMKALAHASEAVGAVLTPSEVSPEGNPPPDLLRALEASLGKVSSVGEPRYDDRGFVMVNGNGAYA